MCIIFIVKYNLNSALIGAGEVHRVFWWGDLRQRDLLETLGLDGGIILKWMFKKWCGEVRTGLLWLRIGTEAGLLGMR